MNAPTDQEGKAIVDSARPAAGAEKIEDTDQRLMDWVGALLPGKTITLSAPSEPDSEPTVNLYLLELRPSPPAKGPRRSPLQVQLGYLVTAWAKSPQESHRMISTLVFGAMEAPEFEVDLAAVSDRLWQAFGVLPRPAFMLRVPLRRERPDEKVRFIKTAIELNAAPMASLGGVLLGPEAMPIANARVALPALRLTARTDERGRFRFAGIPSKTAVLRFHIQARGREFVLEAEHPAGDPEPLIIHINPEDA